MNPIVEHLLTLPQPAQLTKEWFEMRKNKISASSASSLLCKTKEVCEPYVSEYNLSEIFNYDGKCLNPYSSKLQYFIDKVIGSTFKGSTATFHGQKYEQVVIDIYQKLNNTKIHEFGLLNHPTIDWLAASPDGITEEGIVIEIKCPYRRTITGIPPIYYWIQVMLQLETIGLDHCDFTEFEFMEFLTEQEWLDTETVDKKFLHSGILICKNKLDAEGLLKLENNKYIYPPKEIIDNTQELLKWKSETLNNITPDSTTKVSVIYWKVTDKCITRISRNKEWFNKIAPMLEKEWKKMLYYKKGDNYKKLVKPVQSKKKVVDTNFNEITESIKNVTISKDCFLSDTE